MTLLRPHVSPFSDISGMEEFGKRPTLCSRMLICVFVRWESRVKTREITRFQ